MPWHEALAEHGVALRAFCAFHGAAGQQQLLSKFPPWAVDDIVLDAAGFESPPLPKALDGLLPRAALQHC